MTTSRFGRHVMDISDEESLVLAAVRNPRHASKCQGPSCVGKWTPSVWRVGHVNPKWSYGSLAHDDLYCADCLPPEFHKVRDDILAAGAGMTHRQVEEAAATWFREPYRRISLIEIALPWVPTKRMLNNFHGREYSYEISSSKQADVLGLDVHLDRYYIIECKISRADFLRGRTKFDAYQEWCDFFYVAAPLGIVDKSDLPPNIGLLTILHDGVKPYTNLVRAARRTHPEFLNKGPAGERMRIRVMTWLLSYYEGHHSRCERKIALPIKGIWAPMHRRDLMAEAEIEAIIAQVGEPA